MRKAAADPVNRERDGSGHGLLLVILGEFVWDTREEQVWLAKLVRAMAALDVTENATRKALQRLGAAAMLTYHRHGRQTCCALTDTAREAFRDGVARVFAAEPFMTDWDGRWLIVVASIPETTRHLRHFVRSRLERAGMGSPAPGLWISPHVDTPVEALLRDVDAAISPMSFIGRFGPVGGQAEIAAAAWDLGALTDAYRDFVDRFASLSPESDAAMFKAYVGLVQAWRRLAFRDPRLPVTLLPDDWAGRDAARLFRDRHRSWRDAAASFWSRIGEEAQAS